MDINNVHIDNSHDFGFLCSQKGCYLPAAYRYTWPGRDEQYVCEHHEAQLRAVADALGLYLQLIPLEGYSQS